MSLKESNGLDSFFFGVEEKIGLKDYSNIVVRASITRDIPNTDEARNEVIRTVEDVLIAERKIILEDLGVEVKS